MNDEREIIDIKKEVASDEVFFSPIKHQKGSISFKKKDS